MRIGILIETLYIGEQDRDEVHISLNRGMF